MSYAEFPSSEMWMGDKDHHELIEFYLEVRDKYTETLNKITAVSNRLDELEQNMNKEITSQVDVAVAKAVESSLSAIQDSITKLDRDLTMQETVFEMFREKTDETLAEIQSSIDELDNRLQFEIADVNAKIKHLRAEYASMILEAEHRLNDKIIKSSEDTLSEAIGYAARLNATTVADINERLDNMVVASNEAALKWIWQYGCCGGGFSAHEWYHLTNITAEDYHNVSPEAWEWYVLGKEVFRCFRDIMKMFSPVSGHYVDVRVALYELAAKLNIGSITAEEYDALNLTAEEYDRLNLKAGCYDWKGKEKLNAQ